jgi:hypothetical protein
MESRLDYQQIAPGAVQAMRALETYMRQSRLERSLLHLIKTRASQINGALTVSKCTRARRAPTASRKTGSNYLLPDEKARNTVSVNAERWPGPKR